MRLKCLRYWRLFSGSADAPPPSGGAILSATCCRRLEVEVAIGTEVVLCRHRRRITVGIYDERSVDSKIGEPVEKISARDERDSASDRILARVENIEVPALRLIVPLAD